MSTEGLPYDIWSVTHPPNHVISQPGTKAYIKLKEDPPLQAEKIITDYDFLHINLVYCDGT